MMVSLLYALCQALPLAAGSQPRVLLLWRLTLLGTAGTPKSPAAPSQQKTGVSADKGSKVLKMIWEFRGETTRTERKSLS